MKNESGTVEEANIIDRILFYISEQSEWKDEGNLKLAGRYAEMERAAKRRLDEYRKNT